MYLLLLILVILLLFGGGGFYGYRTGMYGPYPLGGLGVVLLVVIIILLFAYPRPWW